MRFVVTGTPRSATGYASLLFKELKIPCTHERVFRPRGALIDAVDWYNANDGGDSSFLAWAFLGLLPGPVPVLHTIRNPWSVVDSLAHRNDLIPEEAKIDRRRMQIRNAMKAYCPQAFAYPDAVNRAAIFVPAWNRSIVEAAKRHNCKYIRYKVEDLDPSQIAKMLEFVNVFRDEYEIEDALRDTPKNVNGGKQMHFGLTVKEPAVLKAIAEIDPDQRPIARLLSAPIKRPPDELEELMEPHIRDDLRRFADECGYSRTPAAVEAVEEHIGV